MNIRTWVRCAASLPLLLLAVCIQPSEAAGWMTLTSTSIKDGRIIPFRFGADDPQRACSPRDPSICPCPGKNVSPALAWHNAPAGTKSFAILMYDVDGQYGAGVSHWVAYNIAPSRTELKEGDGTAGIGFTGGKGTRANANYVGPCPPQGDGPHHYLITVMATDLAPNLAPGLTREEFMDAAKGHFLTSASIGGLFARAYK
jgi:Raf kinase inhibitor-like YbhB/YbcL family protein